MESYIQLIRQDTCHHKSCEDATLWPFLVLRFVQSLQTELKLPRWLKSDPFPYPNDRVLDMLNHVRVSDDVFHLNLWDRADYIIDNDLKQRLHVVFNGALSDCARIQAVVETEKRTKIPFPKESFLALFVRNAILNAGSGLSSLEDIPTIFPRHFGGDTIPILSHITKSLCAPLLISIYEEMSIEDSGSDLYRQPGDDGDSIDASELFNSSPQTISKFLDACEKTEEIDDVEKEPEEKNVSSRFEAYFLACPPSVSPPSICHIPILCMADEERLPVLMSSFLYQRRVWNILDPLIGVQFSKYDTLIRLFVGWLEENVSSDRILPRVHLLEIGTPVPLDLSSPLAALLVSRLLGSLESHVSAIRDTARHSVGAVISGTQSHSFLSWRIDTAIQTGSASIPEDNNKRDTVIKWIESQQRVVYDESMPPHKQADDTSLPAATSTPPPHKSPSMQVSYAASASSVTSAEKNLSIPELREPHEHTDSVPTFCSRISCSAFAATTEKDDHRVFRWMFDRRVVPQSIPLDLEFREEYSAMTCFIWPETWNIRDDLPQVDAMLEPCIQELLDSVAAIKIRPNTVKSIPIKEFPIDLRLLGQSFSAIFQASRRSREKKELRGNVYETSWRHDHDRLLFDFFIRLIRQNENENSVAHPLVDEQSIAHLEDPLARPTLETTLRLPKSDSLPRGSQRRLEKSIQKLVFRESEDLDGWLESRGDALDTSVEEVENAAYVISQLAAWRRGSSAETEAQMISKLGQLPSTGRCDALGRLLVEIPELSPEDIEHLALVVHPNGKNGSSSRVKSVPCTGKPGARAYPEGRGETTTKTSSRSLTIPDVSSGPETKINGTRYTILSSSRPSCMKSLDKGPANLVESMDVLASKIQGLRLERDSTFLELPILTVEYKKASDNVTKGTNQVRMYLTASVKFLQAIGITNMPVYGVQTNGPIVVLPAAIIRDDNFVYLYERLVEKLDISTPLGAWHYATILCRLAQNHAKLLEKRFEMIKENLVASLLKGDQANEWTIDHQRAQLKAGNRAKSPLREKTKKRPEVV